MNLSYPWMRLMMMGVVKYVMARFGGDIVTDRCDGVVMTVGVLAFL